MPEWLQITIALLGAAGLGSAGGVGGALWYVARLEPRMELNFSNKLETLRTVLGKKIEESEKAIEEKQEEQVGLFRDTFSGLREKINQVELEAERQFLSKDAFGEFVREYRDDRKEAGRRFDTILEKLDRLPKGGS